LIAHFFPTSPPNLLRMSKIKYIVRTAFLLLAIFLLIDMNRKTDNKAQSIAEFKLKTFEKLSKDSLDTKHKADLLIDETTKFMDNSSHVKKRVSHLMTLLGLFVVVEIGFLVSKRNNRN
jgi:hypothetical protein